MHATLSKVWIHKPHTKRLFLAIPLPKDWHETLTDFQLRAQKKHITGNIPTNWTKPDNFHITVRFIGSIDEQCVGPLTEFLKEVLAKEPQFSLPFERTVIATPEDPKMIWAQFVKTKEFDGLVGRITDSVAGYLRTSCGGMTLHNGHDVIPHITVARLKGEFSFTGIIPTDVQFPSALSVKRLILNESRTLPSGSVYSVIQTFRLRP